jgi:outer membrane biosynthesis protein TonB
MPKFTIEVGPSPAEYAAKYQTKKGFLSVEAALEALLGVGVGRSMALDRMADKYAKAKRFEAGGLKTAPVFQPRKNLRPDLVGEPKKAEPKKAEPKKAEPKKAEPKKAEPKKAEPKKAEPKKAEPKKAESVEVAPAQKLSAGRTFGVDATEDDVRLFVESRLAHGAKEVKPSEIREEFKGISFERAKTFAKW